MKNIFLAILFIVSYVCNSQITKDKKVINVSSINRTVTNNNSITAAPVNDNCGSAILIPIIDLNGTCLSGYTTISASNDGTTPSCFDRNNNVWFKFVAQGPDIEVTINQNNSGGNPIVNPQVAVFSITGCPNTGYTEMACGGYDCHFCANYSEVWAINNCDGATSLTVGNTYYITVAAGKWGTNGDFFICVNNPAPNPIGTDCSTATLLCSNSTVSGNASLWGAQELTTATNSDCLNTCGEVNSSWYVLNVATSGTLAFTISPTVGTDDYDFAIYKGATCTLGAPISCNYSSTPGNTGLALVGGGGTSQGQGGTVWNNYMNVIAGDVYLVLVNGFTPSANTYTMSFSGTATLGCTLPPILPIELLYFNSSCDKSDGNTLSWASATETNNNYFTIDKSINGVTWDELAKMPGAGNSTYARYYSIKDIYSGESLSYYRLSQTDYNGKVTHLGVVACDGKKSSGVKIYPNPTSDLLNILI